jgi:hypothetical protein
METNDLCEMFLESDFFEVIFEKYKNTEEILDLEELTKLLVTVCIAIKSVCTDKL